jgi:hypothetical protein
MSIDPVDQIIVTGENVRKDEFSAYQKQRGLGVFVSAAEVRTFDLSGRNRILVGSRFFRKDTEDTSADDGTESTSTIIDFSGNHWLLIEGEYYAVAFGQIALISDGEETVPHIFPTPTQLLAGAPGSKFRLRTGPDAEAVWALKKYNNATDTHSTIGTITFAAGDTEGVIAVASDVSFARYDELYAVAPDPRDPSAYTFYGTAALVR